MGVTEQNKETHERYRWEEMIAAVEIFERPARAKDQRLIGWPETEMGGYLYTYPV